ncbi:Copper resistance protein CRF1 [Smittium culicis]|uniref:Copper resistance protein CRF1 n=1 Tax=Smittium culicis TaxID=133412 RepID=A0A1R1XIN0_9FUNG|nr:Copper resistance protein CRF1 [Smittium culicis]OMJ14501.1 Copper resistance protein CRF1 [Smittium culicis]
MIIGGKKYSCKPCIRGHRANKCSHSSRELTEIKAKGRPPTQCKTCKDLRASKNIHSKCICGSRNARSKYLNYADNYKNNKYKNSRVHELLNLCECINGQICICCSATQKNSPKPATKTIDYSINSPNLHYSPMKVAMSSPIKSDSSIYEALPNFRDFVKDIQTDQHFFHSTNPLSRSRNSSIASSSVSATTSLPYMFSPSCCPKTPISQSDRKNQTYKNNSFSSINCLKIDPLIGLDLPTDTSYSPFMYSRLNSATKSSQYGSLLSHNAPKSLRFPYNTSPPLNTRTHPSSRTCCCSSNSKPYTNNGPSSSCCSSTPNPNAKNGSSSCCCSSNQNPKNGPSCCCSSNPKINTSLDSDGAQVCACGCSKPLAECTDCFEDMCEEQIFRPII